MTADSASSPAPLDVPRLVSMCERQASWSQGGASETKSLAIKCPPEDVARWAYKACEYEADAAQWKALAAALSGLVEDATAWRKKQREDQPCGECRHARWVHDGLGCVRADCACKAFAEPAAPALREEASE